MEEDGVRTSRGRHHLRGDLVGAEEANALRDQILLTHRGPDIGIDRVRPGHSFLDRRGDRQRPPGGGRNLGYGSDQIRLGVQLVGCDDPTVHPQLGAAHHERVRHIVAAVAGKSQRSLLQIAELLLDGEQVGEDLGRVPVVGEPVPHRHAGVLGQGLDRPVGEAAELDAVEEPAEDPCRIGHGLLLAELDVRLAQVLRVRSLVDAGDSEGTTGPGGRLFEEQGDVEAVERPLPYPGPFHDLELGRESQQSPNLFWREIQKLEERSPSEINRHRRLQFEAAPTAKQPAASAAAYYSQIVVLPTRSVVPLKFSPSHAGRVSGDKLKKR